MLAELSRSRRELELANQRLEQRVSERTQELVQANQQLLEEIAERQQAQLESAQARDQALDALRLKTQILANISHDARTPLNVIMLRTDLLEAEMPGKLNARQKEMMTSIRNCSRQLLDFMNNLLEEARISTGKLILRKEIVSPRELVQRSVDALGPLVQRKALELRVSISEDVPSSLEGDPLRLEQILNNLVGNAIKFTEQGYIAIDVYCPDEAHWAMVVADTGSGVEPSHRERIFEPFWQLDGSITRKETRGVGLGLAIVKQLTTLMGGTAKVSANPESETGSVFTVTLPLIAVEESMPGLDDRSTASEGR
jgi:signal transduction histidine kinase